MARSVIATVAMLFVLGVASSPYLKTPATVLTPPEVESDSTLATELMPPPEEKSVKHVPFTLFLINMYAIKNVSAEDSNDVLHDDVIGEASKVVAEPLNMFLLIVGADNESDAVSLDDVGNDLLAEGFNIEKLTRNGETRLIKVNLDSVDSKEGSASSEIEGKDTENELETTGKLMKLRRRRSICLSCNIDSIRSKRHLRLLGHNSSPCVGGCGGGGGGGGYYPQPSYPSYPQPRPVYPQPQPYYPQPSCSTCGNNGGGYNGGGSNAYAQASAQASASSYGR